MRKWTLFLVGVGLLCSCSSSDDDERPTSCQKSSRTGTYRVTYLKQSGNCPDLPSDVIQLTGGVPPARSDATCNTVSQRWSNGDCAFEATTECLTSEGAKTRATGITRNVTADGARLDGTISIDITLRDGSYCHGVYSSLTTRL